MKFYNWSLPRLVKYPKSVMSDGYRDYGARPMLVEGNDHPGYDMAQMPGMLKNSEGILPVLRSRFNSDRTVRRVISKPN
jgi:hypothetical protein